MRNSSLLNLESTATNRHDRALALCAMAGAIGILEVKFAGVSFGRGFEMVSIARTLATSGSFANPFAVLATGPTANNPPAYPLILALLFKIFGTDPAVTLAATILAIVMNAFSAALLPYISLSLFSDELPGLIGALLWIGSMQVLPSWDVSYTVAALLAFCVLTSAQITGGGTFKGISAGLLGSIVLLLNPSTAPILLSWLGYLYVSNRGKRKYLLLVILFMCLLPAAWIARNRRELGTTAPRVGFGMTLYASNVDCASPTLIQEESDNCFQTHHPNQSLREAILLQQIGEVEYDLQRFRDAALWIHQNPKKFLQLVLLRLKEFWFPTFEPGSRWHVPFVWLATVLSIPALFLLRKGDKRSLWLLILGLVLYSLPYYVVVSDVRYRYPVLWISLLLAGLSVARLLRRFREPQPTDVSCA